MLNPELFERLRELFGAVRVSNENVACYERLIPDWDRGGRMRVSGHRAPGGANVEHFAVDCPHCRDKRQRLSFDYRYGTPHPVSKRPQIHLIKCFNEDCFDVDTPGSLARRQELWTQVRDGKSNLQLSEITQPAKNAPDRDDHTRLPSNLLPIIDRNVSRLALEYLALRNFDPRELWNRWRVYYCDACFKSTPIIRDERLVIPIYGSESDRDGIQQVVLNGWQARLIDGGLESKSNPKYLTAACFSFGAAVYGLTWAAELKGPIVICEGVTDVWRLGTNAVAVYGKKGKLGLNQERAILAHANGRPIVFFADANAIEETTANIQPFLRAARTNSISIPKCVLAVTPEGRNDPGECDREEAWEAVAKALGQPFKNLGIDLSAKIPPTHPKGMPR